MIFIILCISCTSKKLFLVLLMHGANMKILHVWL